MDEFVLITKYILGCYYQLTYFNCNNFHVMSSTVKYYNFQTVLKILSLLVFGLDLNGDSWMEIK